MANAIIIGAGVAGLGAALALGRDGHEVTIIERDATPMPARADDAFEWDRRGAPQVRHSHMFLARLRNILRDEFPDVREAALAAGATELTIGEMLPEGLDTTPMEGDEDLAMLACRRTTFEWVLRCKALEQDHVTIRTGDGVSGVLAEDGRVVGVRLESGEELRAD
ncbi:MAG TPA: FAD-dependent oxidoreductase, partial [Acidimicrobiales bacterium]|nr:FAD-dependent oxidoreductase [Acidimicrobiales bacterium]